MMVEEESMTYWDYVAEVGKARYLFPNWRLGQAYFNVLARLRPDLADDIRQEVDPFYDDELVSEFARRVLENW